MPITLLLFELIFLILGAAIFFLGVRVGRRFARQCSIKDVEEVTTMDEYVKRKESKSTPEDSKEDSKTNRFYK